MAATQDAKDIKLLRRYPVRFKEIMLLALQPTCRVKKIDHSLLVRAPEFLLPYFFFNFHR